MFYHNGNTIMIKKARIKMKEKDKAGFWGTSHKRGRSLFHSETSGTVIHSAGRLVQVAKSSGLSSIPAKGLGKYGSRPSSEGIRLPGRRLWMCRCCVQAQAQGPYDLQHRDEFGIAFGRQGLIQAFASKPVSEAIWAIPLARAIISQSGRHQIRVSFLKGRLCGPVYD